jgi:RND family efflux transporter MFP subunit
MTQHVRAARVAIWLLIVLVVLGITAGLAAGMLIAKRGGGAAGSAGEEKQLYTCGMHPQVIQEGPGTCPICGMKLTPLKKGAEAAGAEPGGPKERKVLYWRAPMDPNYISDKPGKSPMGMDLVPVYAEEEAAPGSHTIRIDPVTIQNMGIRTTVLRRGPLIKTIRTVGRVDYDEQRVTFINTKFEGWIEKLYVDETGQHVNKGQPLFDVYSRELYSAQEEYLAAVRGLERVANASEMVKQQSRDLLEAARIKLKYMDVSEPQIQELADTKEIKKTLTIYSPAEGIVTEKMALEGMYVKPGMKLYTIADLSRVWVYVDVYEYQLPWVSVGQEATMTLPYIPGETFEGTVVYIYPYLNERTRVIKVRLEFENPGLELKPGMYANIIIQSHLKDDALLIPREAYIDSGKRQVAFQYLGSGKFQPREILVGVEGEDEMVEVLHGLDEGDTVVTSGQFLIDAESKLKEAVAKMMEPQGARTKAPATAPAKGEHGPHPMPADQPASVRPAGGNRVASPTQPGHAR